MVSAAAITITTFPAQVATEEFFSVSGTSQNLAGQSLSLLIDGRHQFGAGTVPANGLWSVRFRLTSAGDRRLVFFAQDRNGVRIESQPVTVKVTNTAAPPLQVTSFPHQVVVEEFLTVNGFARGCEGKPLTLTIDDRFVLGAGNVSGTGDWNVRFRFTDAGNRKLVFSAENRQGTILRSNPVFVTAMAVDQSASLQITSIPTEVKTREEFAIRGISSGLAGLPLDLVIDNQIRASAGAIADDGSWQAFFQFLQSGTRRLTAQVVHTSGAPIVSETATINVVPASPRLKIFLPPSPPRAGEAFILQGEAKNFDDGEELVVQVDRRYVLARPIIENERWQANLFLHQAGQRLIEVIASDEEQVQIVLNVQPITQSLQVFPFSVWTSTPTPNNIPNLVNPTRITLHHTVIAALSPSATQEQEIQRMRRVLDIHLNSSGYSDIGYHYIVMPSGRVYEGRSSSKRGAHDLVNDGFGVAVDGDFQGSFRIGPKQFDAVVGICIMLCRRMGITDPVTPVNTLTADFGTRSLPRIMGHRDRVATACPGTVYERLSEIRQAVRRGLV